MKKFYTKSSIDWVMDNCDIVRIIGSFVELKRAGANYKAPCPFHQEKTPSFVVSPIKKIYHCFGCGVSGRALNFIMEYLNLDYISAVEELSRISGIPLEEDTSRAPRMQLPVNPAFELLKKTSELFHERLLSGSDQAAKDFVEQRKLTKEIISKFDIGFAPDSWDFLVNKFPNRDDRKVLFRYKLLGFNESRNNLYDRFRNRIIFPIKNPKGKVVGFGGRALKTDDRTPKYLNSEESDIFHKGKILYGYHEAQNEVRRNDSIILVEGYMDLISLHKKGIKNVVAPMGTALTRDQLRIISYLTSNLIFFFDNDNAGYKATMRALPIALENNFNIKIILNEKYKDPDDLCNAHTDEEVADTIDNAKDIVDFYLERNKYSSEVNTEKKNILIKDLIKTIKYCTDKVHFSLYIKKLSKVTGIRESILIKESPVVDTIAKPRERLNKDLFNIYEKELLNYLFRNISDIEVVMEKLSIDDFENANMRNVMSKLFQLHDFTGFDFLEFSKDFEEELTREIISVSMADYNKNATIDTILQGFLRRSFIIQGKKLSKNLEEAELTGDKESLEQYLKRKQNLKRSLFHN